MKIFKLIISLIFIHFQLYGSGCYLWESNRDHERSCCLFLSGVDICNPYVPCTRNSGFDVRGIYDYIGRILQVDQGATFSYCKILNQAQEFIKNALESGIRLYYHFDTPQRRVKFYHEIAESARATEKSNKTSNVTTTAAAEKQKNEEAVLAYMMSLGLAWKLK
jgi:hypothetical protein